MTKHDRLMNALKQIKAICDKNEDPDGGCGKKCPFVMAEENGFRDCEVARYTSGGAPGEEWGEQDG